MKDLITPEGINPEVTIDIPAEHKEKVLYARLHLRKGMKLYQINRIDGEITEARLTEAKVEVQNKTILSGTYNGRDQKPKQFEQRIHTEGSITYQYEVHPGCSYVAAINLESALRKMNWRKHPADVEKKKWMPPFKEKSKK